ncbi:MAG TPA: hypothetical protein VFC68_02210 [Treponemataceae bacterium]|nr:hypothetical protein [Treponemataceae bacterium]
MQTKHNKTSQDKEKGANEMKQENNEKIINDETLRLLKEIFNNNHSDSEPDENYDDIDDLYDEDYPSTDVEKISYAIYSLCSELEYIGTVIKWLMRLERLLKLQSPPVIIHHEAKRCLEILSQIKAEIDEITEYVVDIVGENKPDENGNYKGVKND